MEMILQASPRALQGKKLRTLRKEGVLPAVVYGPKEAALPISLTQKDFEKLFAKTGESTLISLAGLGDAKDVLVHDVSYDPVSGSIIHVDFYAIEKGKTLTLDVPIEFEGEAPALKSGSAMITKVLHEIEVECLPGNLPQHIVVDISTLTEIGSVIHVRDIVVPTGVTFSADPDDVVVVISAAEEEVESALEAPDMAAIDVEKKGKKEEEVE